MKFKLIAIAALMAGVISTQASTPNLAAQTNANPETAMTALFGDPPVVAAKNFQIKRSDVDRIVSGQRANALAAGQQLPSDFEAQVLNQLITIQVLLQVASPEDQAAGKADADEQFTNLVSQFVSPEAFQRQLKAVGMTADELRSKAVQEATAKAALKRALKINITDDQARDFYNQHPSDFEQPELVTARHILLMTIDKSTHLPLDTNTITAKRKLIEDIRKRIMAGEDFAKLAKEYSDDSSSENGGLLPSFSRGQMVAEFEAAAFSLNTNEVSQVVTTQFGYHLIKVLDKTPAKKVDFTTAAPKIKDFLTRQQIARLAPDYIKKLRADQQVQVTDPDLKAMDEQFQANQAAAAAAAAPDATK
jgi:parvulin-like peptidyl-prolyl isomerase